jgi:hypothetical protein
MYGVPLSLQQHAPLVHVPRNNAAASTPSLTPLAPVHIMPQPIHASPPIPEPISVGLSSTAPGHTSASKQHASLTLALHDNVPAATPFTMSYAPVHCMPEWFHTSPATTEPFPVTLSDADSVTSVPVCEQHALLVHVPHNNVSASTPTQASFAPVYSALQPVYALLPMPESLSVVLPNIASATKHIGISAVCVPHISTAQLVVNSCTPSSTSSISHIISDTAMPTTTLNHLYLMPCSSTHPIPSLFDSAHSSQLFFV